MQLAKSVTVRTPIRLVFDLVRAFVRLIVTLSIARVSYERLLQPRGEPMLSTQRRTTRVALVLAAAAAAVAGLVVAGDVRGGSASRPSASDYCLTVPSIWVHNQQVYPGGLYCVPVP